MIGDAPLNQDREAWLTDEDISWRPEIEPRPLDWAELRRLLRYEETLPSPRRTNAGSARHQQMILDGVNEQLMDRCYAMMGWAAKPRSVKVCQTLRLLKLPTFGLRWKEYLWFRMLHWEFRQWSLRICNRSHLPAQASVNALLARLPLPGGRADRYWPHRIISGEPNNAEAAILWRWLLARGRSMKAKEWSDFTLRFSGMPWRRLP